MNFLIFIFFVLIALGVVLMPLLIWSGWHAHHSAKVHRKASRALKRLIQQ